MAPKAVLTATALLATISLSSAYDSNYGNSLYARSYRDDNHAPLRARSIQKILARRAAFEGDEDILYARDIDTREADPEADPIGEALFEHDDILFNYKRNNGGDDPFDEVEFSDLITRDLYARSPEADYDDAYLNYKREADSEDAFFDNLEFFDVVSRRDIGTREADPDADPIGDSLFEHDDILFNYKRDIDAREADPDADPIGDALFEHDDILFNYKRDIDTREADPDADPIGDALFEHDDILFNYKRDLDPFDELEFTDLISRDVGFTPWYQSATAQARKGEYKSPGQVKQEQAARNGGGGGGGGGGFAGEAGSGGGSSLSGISGSGGHAFNEALDVSSGGATSMDASAMGAGGMEF